MQRKVYGLRDDLRQPHCGTHRVAPFGKRQQLLREVARPQGRSLGLAQIRFRLGEGLGVEQRKREVAHDRRQDVVEIMGNAAGQDADGLQTGTALHFLLQLRLAGLAGLLGFVLRGHVDRYADQVPLA